MADDEIDEDMTPEEAEAALDEAEATLDRTMKAQHRDNIERVSKFPEFEDPEKANEAERKLIDDADTS